MLIRCKEHDELACPTHVVTFLLPTTARDARHAELCAGLNDAADAGRPGPSVVPRYTGWGGGGLGKATGRL